MTKIQPFAFPETGQQVRTVLVEGEPWFAAVDVCAVLGHTDPNVALRMLDDDEKRTLERSRRSDTPYFEHPSIDRRVQALAVITESGLYSLRLAALFHETDEAGFGIADRESFEAFPGQEDAAADFMAARITELAADGVMSNLDVTAFCPTCGAVFFRESGCPNGHGR